MIGNWTLVYIEDGGYRRRLYEIDLEEINTCGQMLDWIFQLNHKTWMTFQDKADLLGASDSIFDPQKNLCSFGSTKQIDAPTFLRDRYRDSATG
jgi:hypothetical protein